MDEKAHGITDGLHDAKYDAETRAALAKILSERLRFAEVEVLRGKWEASRVYCVAPQDVRMPLHMLAKAGLGSATLEDAKLYLQKINDILEWVWPGNTRQRFDAYQLGDATVEIPAKR